MESKLKKITNDVRDFKIKNSDDLKNFKQYFLVKKGVINNLWVSVKKNPSINK